MEVNDKTKEEFLIWLTNIGINFFKNLIKEHGTVLAAYPECGIPHSVHFIEGMQVRNWMRGRDEFKDKHQLWLDDNWAEFVESILKE
jgi:hypothetical protein